MTDTKPTVETREDQIADRIIGVEAKPKEAIKPAAQPANPQLGGKP